MVRQTPFLPAKIPTVATMRAILVLPEWKPTGLAHTQTSSALLALIIFAARPVSVKEVAPRKTTTGAAGNKPTTAMAKRESTPMWTPLKGCHHLSPAVTPVVQTW